MRRDVGWLLLVAGLGVLVCLYVDHRAIQTEMFVTRVVVDAAQGFPAWRDHIRRHPEDLGCH